MATTTLGSLFGVTRPSGTNSISGADPGQWGENINSQAMLDYMVAVRGINMQGSTQAVLERPAAKPTAPAKPVGKYKPAKEPMSAYSGKQLAEYSEIAKEIGFTPAGLRVEEFKTYLVESGMTVFALKTVTEFMDAKAKAESTGWGWQWCPLRAQDKMLAQESGMGFGRAAGRDFNNVRSAPASDYYNNVNPLYGQVVPLHALKKVAKIEKEFGTRKVVFAVSDYAPAPAFRVDPFLIAIIPNANAARGEGRFVIDVWDEPGFGIEQMLKSDLTTK